VSDCSSRPQPAQARAIFESGHHPNGKFIDVNCAALSESLLEAELFGHEKGAFTGAIETRMGLFGAAHGGVIFLDEIGEMPLKLQAKLLRVLEERKFKRVGGVENIEVSCRVIASTNRSLWQMVEQGEFRRDLFYRLDVFAIHIPPLRERPADIPVLAPYFLKQFSKSCSKRLTGFSPAAMQRLRDYHWPGNVRELRNAVERLTILYEGESVDALRAREALPAGAIADGEPPGALTAVSLREQLEKFEARLLARELAAAGGVVSRVAERLRTDRANLYRKLKRYGLK